jgi:hypothetical protein
MEEGMASENMMGYAQGGPVKLKHGGDPNLDHETGRRKPTYPALEVQEKAIERVEEFPEANKQGEVFKNQKEVKIIEESIRIKKEGGYDTSKDEENLKKKKEELEKNSKKLEEIKEGGSIVEEETTTTEEKTTTDAPNIDTENGGGLNNPSTERDNLMSLENMVKERSELYKSMLGDPKKQLAMQGYLQLAQFGLNLASAQGSNFAAKVANSAKDPLAAFAALGRQAQQDENAISLAAIKSSEDERAQSLKPGSFGTLVNDIMRNKGVTRAVAAAEATEIYAQKSGKTIPEIRSERFQEYLRFYEAELGAGDDARTKANEAIRQEFGSPMYKTKEDLAKEKKDTEETTDTTDTAVIKLD